MTFQVLVSRAAMPAWPVAERQNIIARGIGCRVILRCNPFYVPTGWPVEDMRARIQDISCGSFLLAFVVISVKIASASASPAAKHRKISCFVGIQFKAADCAVASFQTIGIGRWLPYGLPVAGLVIYDWNGADADIAAPQANIFFLTFGLTSGFFNHSPGRIKQMLGFAFCCSANRTRFWEITVCFYPLMP